MPLHGRTVGRRCQSNDSISRFQSQHRSLEAVTVRRSVDSTTRILSKEFEFYICVSHFGFVTIAYVISFPYSIVGSTAIISGVSYSTLLLAFLSYQVQLGILLLHYTLFNNQFNYWTSVCIGDVR